MAGPLSNSHLLIGVPLLVCVFALLASASDFWSKKPYQQWSADEAQRMMDESPWATTLTLSGVQNAVMNGDAPDNHGYRGEMETDPTISYTLQFRSALPVRQAEVRSAELSSHYDKMSAAQRASFDANASKFLAATFPDRVIVAVTFHTNVQEYVSALRSYWESESLPKLSMSVYLNTKNERLSLMAYSFKDDTFQFTFPRPKQLEPNDKISVEFVHPRINVVGQQRVLQEFSVKKMLVDGQPSI
ncbi:MAG TPA: hypothetical protein VMG31_09165 [Verrucomicrobiae bacterium]|nr:hypothetical protein [Verrucomicrobiae bacterium]